jgi:hypothetical protein
MSTKLEKYLIVLPVFSLLVACAQLDQREVQNMAQHAKTYSDHERLANYHDDVANEMKAKAKEKKEGLEHYEDNSLYYGRGGQDYQSHAAANVRYYEQAAEEAQKQAHFHRKIAAELLQREYAKSAEVSEQQNDHATNSKRNSNANTF